MLWPSTLSTQEAAAQMPGLRHQGPSRPRRPFCWQRGWALGSLVIKKWPTKVVVVQGGR